MKDKLISSFASIFCRKNLLAIYVFIYVFDQRQDLY